MNQNPELDVFIDELRSAQSECDVIDAELAKLRHDDASANVRFYSLVDRRRLIGERLIATIERLESAASHAVH